MADSFGIPLTACAAHAQGKTMAPGWGENPDKQFITKGHQAAQAVIEKNRERRCVKYVRGPQLL